MQLPRGLKTEYKSHQIEAGEQAHLYVFLIVTDSIYYLLIAERYCQARQLDQLIQIKTP